jgi:adenylate kinase
VKPKTIGISGTPGTGKKTIAPIVAGLLNATCISLNDWAISHHAGRRSRGEFVVDVKALRHSIFSESLRPRVYYGHLLADVFDKGELDKVAVLRCEPNELKERLISRGYRGHKLRENVEAELIGVIASAAGDKFGQPEVREFDTTEGEPKSVALAIVHSLTQDAMTLPIDWVPSYGSAVKLRSLLSTAVTGPGRT